jgi:hypothetical protein
MSIVLGKGRFCRTTPRNLALHNRLCGCMEPCTVFPRSKSGIVLRDFAKNGGYEFLGLNKDIIVSKNRLKTCSFRPVYGYVQQWQQEPAQPW